MSRLRLMIRLAIGSSLLRVAMRVLPANGLTARGFQMIGVGIGIMSVEKRTAAKD